MQKRFELNQNNGHFLGKLCSWYPGSDWIPTLGLNTRLKIQYKFACENCSCLWKSSLILNAILQTPDSKPSSHTSVQLDETIFHYENKPIQIYWKFYHQKMKKIRYIFWYFSYFCSKHRGGSNEYPQSMFLSRNKKIMCTPINPSFTIYKWVQGGQHYIGMFWWCVQVI